MIIKDLINIEIIAPLGVIYQGKVKSVTLPGNEGEFSVLREYTALVAFLRSGVIDVEKRDLKHELVVIDSGYAKVDEDKVRVSTKGVVWICGSNESEIEENLSSVGDLIEAMSSGNAALAAIFSKLDNTKVNV